MAYQRARNNCLKLIQEINSEKENRNDDMKDNLTNAFIYCKNLLKSEGLLTDTPPEHMSVASIAIGKEIFENIMCIIKKSSAENWNVVVKKEVITEMEECDNEEQYEECLNESNNENLDILPLRSCKSEHIPLPYKQKMVENPKCSRTILRKKVSNRLQNKRMLEYWKNYVQSGRTTFDKWKYIKLQTFEMFQEANKRSEPITTKSLQQWAMEIATPLLTNNFHFCASRSWVERFKQTYKIDVKQVASKKEWMSESEILREAEEFQRQIRMLMSKFDFNYVINTSHLECPYYMRDKVVLQRSKFVEANSSIIRHFYTVQYSLTASGKILPVVFLCLQESKFSPSAQREINKLMKDYKNVYVRCSRSGRLSKPLYIEYLQYCLFPYVGNNKFLLLINPPNSADTVLYDDIFRNEMGNASCTVKVIPSDCSSLCQPCDKTGYFYSQIEAFIKRLHNFSTLLQNEQKITTRKGIIKIHSLLLHQLSAPIFKDMFLYAWSASNLIETESKFLNIKDICFPAKIIQEPCACQNAGFIRCAHCDSILCFDCFYEKYHPYICTSSTF